MKNTPSLIVIGGLPGVGKTSIAKALANHASAFYLRIDTIEHAIQQSAININSVEDSGYNVAYQIAKENLLLGNSVIADAVHPLLITRTPWESIANQVHARLMQIEITCSDLEQHKERVEQRMSDLKEFKLPSWQDVLDRCYEAWENSDLIIDTAKYNVTESISIIMSRLG